ncbi:MAG TPA: hypothetical protein VHP12_04115 [Chitinophagaceae bacterium]|nr:hypothetical protein [Chitinophagaceae bacterium]
MSCECLLEARGSLLVAPTVQECEAGKAEQRTAVGYIKIILFLN